jgi:hypothetical protein
MKKIFILVFLTAFTASMFAQVPKVATKVKSLAGLSANGLTIAVNPSYADTLKSTDTIFYKTLVNHSNIGYPYVSLLFKGVAGADTATVTVTFWQSVDGTHNWTQVLNTTSPTAWATSLTKAVQKAGGMDIDFWRSVGWFQSTYLGVRLICGTSSSFKGIYYGAIRFNSGK